MTSVFISIPPEIIEAISDELDVCSLKQLRLSCKHFGQTIVHRVMRSIIVELTRANVEEDMNKLRELASQKSPVSKWVKELTILGLSPSIDRLPRALSWHIVDGGVVKVPEPEISSEMFQAEREMPTYLFKALQSFENVQNVKWSSTASDSKWVQNTVYKAIKTLPSLQALGIDISHIKVPLQLDDITGLHSISIHGTRSYDRLDDKILDSLAKMISKSPQIASIDLLLNSNWSFERTPPQTHSLHQIFKYYPNDAPPLRLRHLGLTSCLVRLEDKILRHLRSLNSLKLSRVIDPHAPVELWNNDEESDLTEHKRIGGSPDEFWRLLIGTGIQLREIEHEHMSTPLLEYLDSYPGLKRLISRPDGCFDVFGFEDSQETDMTTNDSTVAT